METSHHQGLRRPASKPRQRLSGQHLLTLLGLLISPISNALAESTTIVQFERDTEVRLPERELDVTAARAVALARSPALARARAEIDRARADLRESTLYPNPELSFEGEEIAPNFSLNSGLVMTLINQTIITGGKRRFRIQAAGRLLQRAVLAYQQEALEVDRDATKAFYDVLATEAKLTATRELADRAGQFHRLVKARVTGGDTRPIEADRALVLAAEAAFDVKKETADIDVARQNLATILGLPLDALPETLNGELTHRGLLPDIGPLREGALEASPLLKIPGIEEQVAHSERSLAGALAIPDVTVGVGYNHRAGEDTQHDLRGFRVNVPLPVFNHGQAARDRARAGIRVARTSQVKARLDLENRLVSAYRNGQRAHEQVETYLSEILPAARRAVDLSLKGYQAGKFTYLEVLDAQRSLTTSTRTYIDALLEYRKLLADLSEITASEIKEVPENRTNRTRSGRTSKAKEGVETK